MLQFIYGKFFESDDPDDFEIVNQEVIVYSNFNSYTEQIISSVANMSKVSGVLDENKYILNYNHKIETAKLGRGIRPVALGHNDFVKDFLTCCSFYFNSIFTTNSKELQDLMDLSLKYNVNEKHQYSDNFYCKNNPSDYFSCNDFNAFLTRMIRLKRTDYRGVLNSIKAFILSVKYYKYDQNLAYLLLVFALESLAQTFDNFKPDWNDVEDEIRPKLEKEIFPNLSDDLIINLKSILFSRQTLRCSKRFRDFCLKNISQSFFREEALNIFEPCKKSEILTLIKNTYGLRSKYAHELKTLPPVEPFYSEILKSETIRIKDNYYFSFSALLRLTKHIIGNVIVSSSLIRNDKESFDYMKNFSELSKTVRSFEIHPKEWIASYKALKQKNIHVFLAGYIRLLFEVEVFLNPRYIYKELMDKIKELIPTVPEHSKRQLIVLYLLQVGTCNVNDNFPQFLSLFTPLTIEKLLLEIIVNGSLNYKPQEIESIYNEYEKKKYKNKNLKFNNYFEVLILAEIANKYLANGRNGDYKRIICKIVEERPGNNYLIALEKKDEFENIDINILKVQLKIEENKKSLSQNKNDIKLIEHLSQLNYEIGNIDSAIKYYQQILRINPYDSFTYNQAANLLLEKGELDKALEYTKKAINYNIDDWMIFDTLGDIYYKKNDQLNAFKYYSYSFKMNPRKMYCKLVDLNLFEEIQEFYHNYISKIAYLISEEYPNNGSDENWFIAEDRFKKELIYNNNEKTKRG